MAGECSAMRNMGKMRRVGLCVVFVFGIFCHYPVVVVVFEAAGGLEQLDRIAVVNQVSNGVFMIFVDVLFCCLLGIVVS